ncbi:hypothetical protein [Faecalibacter rhinopitheci]|uniref:Energy transducer TonB n=1 Tax=Faecalibacter rhinopitheci TaxID=2779678 RepID=A0A8J7FUN9_9FLAO|nr:hypothetical protein [Faecalibacter rhinopitheci]MBF0598137.1 hypothetical protein [Faecalibacter rhinopitheci]
MSDNNKNIKSLDEIVFENRNKAYGAYDLRMTENRSLLRALLRGGLIILLLVGAVLLSISDLGGSKNEDVTVDVQLADIVIPDVPEEEEPEVVEPEPEPEVQQNHYQEETAQEKFVMPEPKPEPKVQETVPPADDLKGKDLSFEKREGKESTGQTGGGPVNLNPEAPKNTTQAPKNDSKSNEPAAPATVTARSATVMAIYPGCEKDAAKGKQQAIDCMSKRLSADIGDELSDFADIAERDGITNAVAKLNFQIDTQGRIVKVSPQGDAKLGPEAKKALERITQKQQKRGKTIKPAESDDGRPAVLQFNIPVRFQQM